MCSSPSCSHTMWGHDRHRLAERCSGTRAPVELRIVCRPALPWRRRRFDLPHPPSVEQMFGAVYGHCPSQLARTMCRFRSLSGSKRGITHLRSRAASRMRAVRGGYMSSSQARTNMTWRTGCLSSRSGRLSSPGSTGPRPGSPVTSLDLTGYPIVAVDGDIGHVDEATYEVGSSYLVVRTGPWIFAARSAAGRSGGADRHRRTQGVRGPDQGPDQELAAVRRTRR